MNCELCGGQLAEKFVTHAELSEEPAIVKNVFATVCLQCNGEILTPPVLENIKKIIKESKPVSYINIPVYDLSGKDMGDPRLLAPEYHPPARCVFKANTDLRALKNIKAGKTESTLWIKGGNDVSHPDNNILKQLLKAFENLPESKVKNIVEGAKDGYILYELKEDFLDEEGNPRKLPVAKMTLIKNKWQLYWIWRSGIWQEYDIYNDLNQVIDRIKEDKLRFCA